MTNNNENLHGHTILDFATLERPDRVQPRERAVRCQDCGTETWNVGARCDRHHHELGMFRSTTPAPSTRGNVSGNNP